MKEGWEYKKIKDIGSVIGGTTPNTNVAEYWDGTLCWISPAELDGSHYLYDSRKKITEAAVKAKSLKLLPEGTVILSSRAPIGKVVINKVPTYCNQGFKCVVCGKEVYNEFLYWWLWGKTEFLNSLGTGATFKEISKKVVEEITIPVPPLSEQQSIVDYLDSAFAKIDAMKANAEKSLNEAKALFQASLKEMLEPKEGWEVATIGNLGDIFGRIGFRGYTKNDLVAGPDEGAITLSPSNIQDGRMDYTNCTYISWFKYEESPEIMIENGDVLIVKTGSSYGKSAFVENLPHKATINPQSVVIKNIKINNKFFAYLIRTPWVMAKFDDFVSGTAIPTFSQAKLSQVELSYPSNDLQNEICNKLDSLKSKVDKLQENYDKISQECDALKQAILRQVFE